MSNRRLWSSKEDQILRLLKEEQGVKKWSAIARKMESEYNLPGRTGKQCRERYHNHLDRTIHTLKEWSREEEQSLYHLHDQLGNKWSLIARQLPGRTDNCVKNHFYSKLRKNMRRLNKFLSQHSNSLPLIEVQTLYRILAISQDNFKSNTRYQEPLIDHCIDLKNQLYRLDWVLEDEKGNQASELLRLAEQMNEIAQTSSRNRSKKSRDLEQKTGSEHLKKDGGDHQIYEIFKRVCKQMLAPL